MRALVWHGPHDLRLEELDSPEPGADEALIRPGAVGICGSDIHGYTGASGRRTPGTVMGHELAGTVEGDGERTGRRVAVNPLVACGQCAYCRAGMEQICADRKTLGVNMGRRGAFADLVAAPLANLVPLGDATTDAEGAMAEPLAVGLRAVNLSGLQPGDPALVLGAGTIGLCALLACSAKGIGPVLITDRVQHRLDVARALGGEAVHADEDVGARVREATEGLGVRAALDAVGIGPTLQQALESTRRGGAVVLIGLATPRIELPVYELVPQERTIHGSYAYANAEYREAVRLIDEREVDVRPLLERTVSLEQATEAFEALATGEDSSVKVIVRP